MWFVLLTVITVIASSKLDDVHIVPLWGVYSLITVFTIGVLITT